MSDLFLHQGNVDPRYALVRDHLPELRGMLEREWNQFARLADPHFRNELATDFESRAWEMRVGALLDEIQPRVSSNAKGLDFFAPGPPRVWVECVAPTSGEGPGAVPPVPELEAILIDEDSVMRRYSSAIWDKHKNQIARGRRDGTIPSQDAVIVALSAAKIELARFLDPLDDWPRRLPWLLRVLYGYGNQHWIRSKEGIETFFPHDPTTPKPGRGPISTAFFASPEFSELGGVLFTSRDTQNRPFQASNDDLVMIHNPLAENPLPRGWLEHGIEFWVDDPDLYGTRIVQRTDWRPDVRLQAT